VLDATCDEAVIRSWWNREPRANIGIALGKASGIFAIDVDPRSGGDAALESLLAAHGPLPSTVEAVTGGGGRHILLRYDPRLDGVTWRPLATGVDVKGDRGYIVAAPSIHPNGSTYAWEHSSRPTDVPIADPPAWLIDRLRRGRRVALAHEDLQVIHAGSRNLSLARYAGGMRHAGLSGREIEAALHVMNADRCDPPLDRPEVAAIAASIARYPPGRRS